MQRKRCKGKKKAEWKPEFPLKIAESFTFAAFDRENLASFVILPRSSGFSFVKLRALSG